MYLRVVAVSLWAHIPVPVGLILCDVVSKACNDSSVEHLLLAANLMVIGGCRPVFNLQTCDHSSNKFIVLLHSIIVQKVCGHTVPNEKWSTIMMAALVHFAIVTSILVSASSICLQRNLVLIYGFFMDNGPRMPRGRLSSNPDVGNRQSGF